MADRVRPGEIKLQGHEKFALREGWLSKGLEALKKDPRSFYGDHGPDVLGIGANMVKSLRYWMLAMGLTKDLSGNKGINLTSLGRMTAENDPYFEDEFTLWILHSNLVKNISKATTWHMYFNHCESMALEKEQIFEIIKREIDVYVSGKEYSERSLRADVDVLLAMYSRIKDFSDPEDKNISPFSQLGLIRKTENKYIRCQPHIEKNTAEYLLRYELTYAQVENADNGISIERFISDKNGIAPIYQLGLVKTNEYLDNLSNAGFIHVDRTAGLDMIYFENNSTPEEIIGEYYKDRYKEL